MDVNRVASVADRGILKRATRLIERMGKGTWTLALGTHGWFVHQGSFFEVL